MMMTGPEVKVDGLSDSRLMSRRTAHSDPWKPWNESWRIINDGLMLQMWISPRQLRSSRNKNQCCLDPVQISPRPSRCRLGRLPRALAPPPRAPPCPPPTPPPLEAGRSSSEIGRQTTASPLVRCRPRQSPWARCRPPPAPGDALAPVTKMTDYSRWTDNWHWCRPCTCNQSTTFILKLNIYLITIM